MVREKGAGGNGTFIVKIICLQKNLLLINKMHNQSLQLGAFNPPTK